MKLNFLHRNDLILNYFFFFNKKMSISLTSSIQSCTVNTGYANKLQSDRTENPNAVMCPMWDGRDTYGRAVCGDSYYTKNAGCNSALDRVAVENFLRPSYAEFIALDVAGYLSPSAIGMPVSSKDSWQKQTELLREQAVSKTNNQGGSVGLQTSANVRALYSNGKCGVDGGGCSNGVGINVGSRENYMDTRANQNFQDRRNLSGISSWKSNCYACSAGNR